MISVARFLSISRQVHTRRGSTRCQFWHKTTVVMMAMFRQQQFPHRFNNSPNGNCNTNDKVASGTQSQVLNESTPFSDAFSSTCSCSHQRQLGKFTSIPWNRAIRSDLPDDVVRSQCRAEARRDPRSARSRTQQEADRPPLPAWTAGDTAKAGPGKPSRSPRCSSTALHADSLVQGNVSTLGGGNSDVEVLLHRSPCR